MIGADKRALDDPAPAYFVSNLADSSVNITVRVWTSADDYWPVRFDMPKAFKEAFDKAGISIPFPQRDVHVYHHGNQEAAEA